jgi:hypothetical protein
MDAVAGARDVDTGGALSEVPREGDTTYPGLLFGDGGISLDGDADSLVVGDVVYGGVLYDDASLTSASSYALCRYPRTSYHIDLCCSVTQL